MTESMFLKLKQRHVVIVFHEYTYGPTHALREYLKGKVKLLTFIAHPFVFAYDIRSHITQYNRDGIKKSEKFSQIYFKNTHASAIKDCFLTCIWIMKYGPFDYYIGVDGLSACIGILFKFIGRTRRVIFYTIDFVPMRFSNPFINLIYHAVDRVAVWGSDCVWNVSQAISDARSDAGYPEEHLNKQIIVPIGAHRRIHKPFSDIKKTHAVHMGHIIKKQGVQLMLDALPFILQKIPDFHFHIVGSGDYEPTLKKQAKKLGISEYVTFHGYIEDHRDVEQILADCSIGIATYEDSTSTFTKYADPGKVKIYLACSLPVIITRVPDIWKDIHRKKCGLAIAYSSKELANAVYNLLKDTKQLEEYREHAYKMSEQFTYKKIFEKAILDTIYRLE